LLKYTSTRSLFNSRWFPLIPQIAFGLCLVLLVIGGWGITAPDAAYAKVVRNTNLANLIV